MKGTETPSAHTPLELVDAWDRVVSITITCSLSSNSSADFFLRVVFVQAEMMQEADGGDGTAPHALADLRRTAAAVIHNRKGLEDNPPLSEEELENVGAVMKASQELQTCSVERRQSRR